MAWPNVNAHSLSTLLTVAFVCNFGFICSLDVHMNGSQLQWVHSSLTSVSPLSLFNQNVIYIWSPCLSSAWECLGELMCGRCDLGLGLWRCIFFCGSLYMLFWAVLGGGALYGELSEWTLVLSTLYSDGITPSAGYHGKQLPWPQNLASTRSSILHEPALMYSRQPR